MALIMPSKKGFSCGRSLVEYLRDGDHIRVFDRGAVSLGLKTHTKAFGEACPVHRRASDGSTHCPAIQAMNEVERHRKLAVDGWREK